MITIEEQLSLENFLESITCDEKTKSVIRESYLSPETLTEHESVKDMFDTILGKGYYNENVSNK